MKCWLILIMLCYCCLSSVRRNRLRVDVIEAVNVHCVGDNELNCNTYTVVQFKYCNDKESTQVVKCTNNPRWFSSFDFVLDVCKDIIYVELFQLNGNKFLGRVVIELEKLPSGIIDDWFMVEDNNDNNDYIRFPSCVHLRLNWKGSLCKESKYKLYNEINLPICKRDFVSVYKMKYSSLQNEMNVNSGMLVNNNNTNNTDKFNVDNVESHLSSCAYIPNRDYAFLHQSKLTYIEEALAVKIIKITTGIDLHFPNISSSTLSIQNINNILHHNAMNTHDNELFLNSNSNNIYDTINTNVYNKTISQFNIIESIKHIDALDDDSYIKSLNLISETIKDIQLERKIYNTLHVSHNKIQLTNNGLIHENEKDLFKIFALYKLDGGLLSYDNIKKEYMLNRKYFSKYESNTTSIPNNIIFMFTQGNCPYNFVCVDPNGVIVNSNEQKMNNVYLYNNEFDRLYIQRYKDIEVKKEMIINILYSSLHPFIGEVLFITKMDNCTSLSMSNETEILKKYLMILNNNYLPYINDSVEIVLSLVVNNTQFKLMLNNLLEGVCSVVDDQNSIHIFIEIIRTIIIHYVIQFHAISVNNIRGKITLLKILNNTFVYLPITKIRFVNELLMFDEIKEKIINIIWTYDTNSKINEIIFKLENTFHNNNNSNNYKLPFNNQRYQNIMKQLYS